ncbi:MCP four helix bundle domain-containing protein [Lacipirellula parvula]|uniref:Chemotaxis methyl-accepting receptor HlyB-like 4HB MCP domain-containing protein n=1 Tax=Lacipirellula parvula TaxID=2650471 RepID=A0A5K7XQG2_9BACT|nr:MCP four helix bundle domain-containing protein [Lacipirellula parvula]BBO35869.1 hypothetical protein PLANPX_5481 [Lacipirellula parvula]
MSVEETKSSVRTSLVAVAILVVLLFGAYLLGVMRANRGLTSTLEERTKKDQLVASMLLNLHAAAEAEKRAVLAETDEESKTNADEAGKESAAVEAERLELGKLIDASQRTEERKLLDEFDAAWKEYQTVDEEILDLDAENTNLKALRLSYGPAAESLDQLDAALNDMISAADATGDRAALSTAAFQAAVSAGKIYAMQSRHIAETNDDEMDRIEGQMTALNQEAESALQKLSELSGPAQQANVAKAQAAYEEFRKIHAQILELSRRNSNVRSLALSLGKKRSVTARCLEVLDALQKSIRSEKDLATRW